ncbi:MAG: protein-disulfide reductase DsbD [Granulosicoccus sp.]
MTEMPDQKRFWRLKGLPTACVAGIVALGSMLNVNANLFGGDEPLAPEVAFAAEILSINDQAINIEFSIEEGYYLYRDKLGFTLDDDSSLAANGSSSNLSTVTDQAVDTTLGTPEFAEALVVTDDFFGEQAIFRHSTVIRLPYSGQSQAQTRSLSIKFQGCADIGLCYPPTTTTLQVELPARADLAATNSPLEAQLASPFGGSSSGAERSSLGDLLTGDSNSEQLLPPEIAYLPQIAAATPEAIDIRWFIEDGYYLYRDKLSFELTNSSGLEIVESLVSEGVEQFDEFFGDVSILRQSADARILLSGDVTLAQLAASASQLIISYQGCADIGVCFPPSQTTLDLSFSATTGTAPQNTGLVPLIAVASSDNSGNSTSRLTAANAPDNTTNAASSLGMPDGLPAQSEQDRLSSLLGSSSLWLTVATFFGLGLLLAFTPCVLPMIPILSSLIVGQGPAITTGRAFKLSLVYVLVMASTYALVGVVVGLSGYNVQAFLQDPVVLSAIAILFVLLSLSMFGFYELQVPVSMQNKLTQWSNRQGGGQVGGVAAMGFISTLIVGPCVTAPLAGALIYIAKTGDAVVGGSALFALGLGMGAPLLLIGTSAGKFVPKAGAWMNTTKSIFGILMLCMAVYMISRFLPTTVIMALYGIIAVMSGVYLGATDTLSGQSSGWQRFGKGAGLVVAVYGLALLVGALAGGNSYTTPLGALASSGSGSEAAKSDHALPFQRVKTVENLQSVVAQASAQGRPVMLDFYADWCISCKEMEAFTFSDKRVQDLLSTAIVVQADVTANDNDDQAMLKQFDLFGPPGIIFYNTSGQELPAARVVGFMNADNFSAHIQRFIYRSDT